MSKPDHTRSFSWLYFVEGVILFALAVGLTWAYLSGYQNSSYALQGVFLGGAVALYAGALWLVHLAFSPCGPVVKSLLAGLVGGSAVFVTLCSLRLFERI